MSRLKFVFTYARPGTDEARDALALGKESRVEEVRKAVEEACERSQE